jgi:hypothetical protein
LAPCRSPATSANGSEAGRRDDDGIPATGAPADVWLRSMDGAKSAVVRAPIRICAISNSALQDGQRLADTLLAAARQRIKRGPADLHRIRPERQGARDIGTGAKAAVDKQRQSRSGFRR